MRQPNYLVLFLKYFSGYFFFIFLIALTVLDGRALMAEASWQWDKLDFGLNYSSPSANPVTGANDGQTQQSVLEAMAGVNFSESDYYLVIPKIKVKTPIVFPNTLDNVELLNYLEKGVIHYRESATVGEQGTAILLGHSSAYPWYRGKYGSVFALLEKLEPGDQFGIVAKSGKKLIYQISNKKVVVPKDFKVEITDDKSHLILISCWPVRSNKLRMTVWSDLIWQGK